MFIIHLSIIFNNKDFITTKFTNISMTCTYINVNEIQNQFIITFFFIKFYRLKINIFLFKLFIIFLTITNVKTFSCFHILP